MTQVPDDSQVLRNSLPIFFEQVLRRQERLRRVWLLILTLFNVLNKCWDFNLSDDFDTYWKTVSSLFNGKAEKSVGQTCFGYI
jgi:hypothetical protein